MNIYLTAILNVKHNLKGCEDKKYIDMINALIPTVLAQYENLDPHLLWEMLKISVRDQSMAYSRIKSMYQKREKLSQKKPQNVTFHI